VFYPALDQQGSNRSLSAGLLYLDKPRYATPPAKLQVGFLWAGHKGDWGEGCGAENDSILGAQP
jgi:hypothetical protein